MNLGINTNIITVQQLYDYAVQHKLLNIKASIVLNIMHRERNISIGAREESNIVPMNNDTIDFGKVEYTTKDVLNLFNS